MRLPSSFDLLPAAFPFMGSLAVNDNYGAAGGVGVNANAFIKIFAKLTTAFLWKRYSLVLRSSRVCG